MWTYEKKLQFPVNITNPDPAFAKIVISQIGGPDGELSASMRYLNQRYSMPYARVRAMLTDIGTEECVPKSYLSKKPLFMGYFWMQVQGKVIRSASITYR